MTSADAGGSGPVRADARAAGTVRTWLTDEQDMDVTVRRSAVPSGSRDRDSAFTAFVVAHQGELLRTAWLMCGDRHRAEELTQQALVRTYGAWSKASAGGPVAYARRVLVNLRIDTWRRRRREVLLAPETMPEDGGDQGPAPRGTAEAHADRDLLVRALATLTPRQRRVVVLRHLMDLSEADVARDLGVSTGTVKSTASRALAQLRVALAEEQPDPRDPTTPTRRTR